MMNERLIQRCVDNELTSAERTELLQQLDQRPDGWRLLACTFMEEQLFAAAVAEPDEREAARLVSRPPLAAVPKRHWFHHPLTSIGLSVCVAFLLGVLINRQAEWRSSTSVAAQAPAGSSAVAASANEPRPGSAAAAENSMPTAVLASRPAAQRGSDGQPAVSHTSGRFDDRQSTGLEYGQILQVMQMMHDQWEHPPGPSAAVMERFAKQHQEMQRFLKRAVEQDRLLRSVDSDQ